MVTYIDNGILCGWYFVKEDLCLGDGTEKTAMEIAKRYKNT